MCKQSLFLPDGIELRLVLPISRTGGHPLFASTEGILYSFHHGTYHPLRPQHTSGPKNKKNGRRKQIYHKMSDRYGNILVHHAVALAFIGQRPVEWLPPTPKFPSGRFAGFECHHLNGITTDNRPSNLIWLSHADHRRFDAALAQGLILTRADPDAHMDHDLTRHREL